MIKRNTSENDVNFASISMNLKQHLFDKRPDVEQKRCYTRCDQFHKIAMAPARGVPQPTVAIKNERYIGRRPGASFHWPAC